MSWLLRFWPESLRLGSWSRGAEDAPAPYDRFLVTLSFVLMSVGLIAVCSASIQEGLTLTGDPFYFVKRHALFLCLALGGAVLVLRQEMNFWQRNHHNLLLTALVLLVLVLIVGRNVNGSTRWIPLGPINFQPAEFAKLALILFLASYFVRRQDEVRRFLGFIKPFMVVLSLFSLLLLQPDLGSGVVLFVIAFGMLFIAGANIMQFVVLIGAGVGGFIVLVLAAPYRMRRVTSFLDPWADPYGSGYQLTQSLMAFGRGSWLGEGLGNSIQKMEYLPEAHTDFVFAILGEEIGYVGVALVLGLLFLLAIRAIQIGQLCVHARRFYDANVAFGIGIWFSFQTFVNIGAASGMMPTKGLTLPLVSYGGSSLIIMTAAAAILVRIDYERRAEQMAEIKEVTDVS